MSESMASSRDQTSQPATDESAQRQSQRVRPDGRPRAEFSQYLDYQSYQMHLQWLAWHQNRHYHHYYHNYGDTRRHYRSDGLQSHSGGTQSQTTSNSYYPPSQSRSYSSGHNSRNNGYNEELLKKVSKYRRFHKHKSTDQMDSKRFQFSIMSYNILSQNLLENHSYLYQHCSSSDIKWPDRGHRLVKEISQSNCDIICLQEVHSQHFTELFWPKLKDMGYNYIYKQRTGSDKRDGCAILYKEDKFALSSSIKLDLMRRDLSHILNRDNIAIIAEFKPKPSHLSETCDPDSKLIVANTHLLYNSKRGDVKLAQLRLLMAELDKLSRTSKANDAIEHNPVVLCGDFNSEPNSVLYDFVTKGSVNLSDVRSGDISGQKEGSGKGRKLEAQDLELWGVSKDTRFETSETQPQNDCEPKMRLKHSFGLKSVINHKLNHQSDDKPISTYNFLGSGLVDHIFYDNKKLNLIGHKRMLTLREMNELRGIPNSVLGSDHLCLEAHFAIV